LKRRKKHIKKELPLSSAFIFKRNKRFEKGAQAPGAFKNLADEFNGIRHMENHCWRKLKLTFLL
jgi:hypothetical protein